MPNKIEQEIARCKKILSEIDDNEIKQSTFTNGYIMGLEFAKNVEKQAITDFMKKVLPREYDYPTHMASKRTFDEGNGFKKCLDLIRENAKKFIN